MFRASSLTGRAAVLAGVLLASAAGADEIPHDAYLTHVPLSSPRLVRQTEASAALHLFGDRDAPGYRDESPADGIDDARYETLMALVVRFAPYLIQNTEQSPVRFSVYAENRDSFPITLDTWDVSDVEPRLAGTERVDLREDARLLDLLRRFSPVGAGNAPAEPHVRDRPEEFHVLYLDFPGNGPASWGQGYRPEYENTSPEGRRTFTHAYVHPFLLEVEGESGAAAGYELVLQYWFFYPSNDSGMNHEGDWEHLNVTVSPQSMVERPLSEAEVAGILEGELPATDDAADPLVIKRLDYYFHHLVMTLDFASPNAYLPRDEWKEQVRSLPKPRLSQGEIWDAVRRMAWVDEDETVVNPHAFGYIGADNKGLNQALVPPGNRNQDPHGTFPLPGRYQNVGPGGTTDQIPVFVDPRRYWKDLAAGRATKGPEFQRGKVVALDSADRLTIVPDWERVVDLVRDNPEVRREWAWLILPMRWGYPATVSPFSGILEHFDTGNVAPVGPSFNPGWNASGSAPGYIPYEPHWLPSVFPLGVYDSFRNGLGWFNLTAPVLLNLPPLDFAARIAAYPFKRIVGRRDPVFYPEEGLPFRFVGLSSGISRQKLDEDFNALAINPQQIDEFLARFILHVALLGDSTTAVVGGGDFLDDSVEPYYQMAFYIGNRFASENTVRNVRSSFGLDIEFNNIPSYSYRADINHWEYAGSLRYSLSSSRLQPFVKAGYGWSWTRLENVRANGIPFDPEDTDWVGPDSIWPNVWHYGLGLEIVPWKRVGKLPGGAEIGLRAEYAWYTHQLGLDLSGVTLDELGLVFPTLGDVPGGDRVTRGDLSFGLTVSF
ncbi:MAG TPA: hypothetical protein VKU85_04440 [bacterium]|nr:hypothetical protein [bacterium]